MSRHQGAHVLPDLHLDEVTRSNGAAGVYLLYYFWTRAADRLLAAPARPAPGRAEVDRADERLSLFAVIRRNLIRLVRGFTVPGTTK
jgi:hypothetical protein